MRYLILIASMLAGCASMQVRSSDEPGVASIHPATRSRVEGRTPSLRLRQWILGTAYTTDQLLRGSTPAAAQYIPCSTSTTQAAWSPASGCWSTFTLGNPGSGNNGAVGWAAYPDATGVSYEAYQFGDNGTGILSYFGGGIQPYAYHGMAIDIGEGGTIPARNTGDGFSLTLHNSSSSIAMTSGTVSGAITLTAGTSGSVNINSGSSGTIALSPGTGGITLTTKDWVSGASLGSIGLQACADTAAFTMATIPTTATCAAGIEGVAPAAVSFQCYVSTTGNVKFHFCNPTTAIVSLGTATYTCRCFRN